jgi:uncharacterized protein (TIGR02246 family)
MLKITHAIVPLAIAVSACGDSPSAVPRETRPGGQPLASIHGGTSANEGIDALAAALNAAWVAKDAAAYAAPFAEDAEVISPLATYLSGRAGIEARHVFLFNGPLATSTYVISVRRVQFLTGTIAIVDLDALLSPPSPGLPATTPGVLGLLTRWVVTKNHGAWEIAAAQSTAVPPAP